MLTVFVRTLLLYALLLCTMRVMGKRQLGELEVSDLVTALLLSEIASLPITNSDVPLLHALVPILTLTVLELILSAATLRIPAVKRLFSVKPTLLVRDGVPDRRAMRSARITSEELMSQLRQKEVTDLSDVDYAILEPNGQLSIILRPEACSPTLRDVGLEGKGQGLFQLVVSDGRVNENSLRLLGRDRAWLAHYLTGEALTLDEVFLLLCNEAGEVRLFLRSEGQGRE